MICEYGCGQEAKHQFKNGKWCCIKYYVCCPGVAKKNSESLKGRCVNAMYRIEIREKIRETLRGKFTGENSPFYGKHHTDSFKNKQRLRMINGGAAHAQKFIKSPSEEELKLRKIVEELFPTSRDTYKILNYCVDIAIVDHKIAIEFDGYYHFDCQHNIDYHNKRQQEIEEQGWRFLRYTIFQKFPSKEQVKEDIQEVVNSAGIA